MAIDTLGANALASNSVTTAKIAADAVTSAKIPADAVIASDIADGSITTAKLADNSVTSAKALNLGRRNLIINGALNIDQRLSFGTTTTADGSGYLGDRLNIEGLVGGGGATMQVVSDAPDAIPNGRSAKVTVTSTDTSLAAADRYTLRHIIEGQNCKHLGFGTSNAKTCTLSFYVKSSLTGTFCVSVGNGANNRGRPFEYTINSANTWERKTIEVAGDTSGTYLTDTGRGIILRWCMGVGSARQAAAGSYSAQEVHGTSNQTNLFATNSATFQITGLQFEEGSVATDFEHLSVGEELSLCQRYYIQTDLGAYQRFDSAAYADLTSRVYTTPQLPTTMRATPTVTQSGLTVDGAAVTNLSGVLGTQHMSFILHHGSSKTANESWQVYPTGSGSVKYDSEI